MKTILLVVITLMTFCSYSQETTQSYSDRNSIHIGVLPLMYFNSVAVGFGIKKQKFEHVFELNSYLVPDMGARFALGLHYNWNSYLKKDKFYIPFWIGINRVNVDNNYEDGGPNYDKMNIRIGSGIGRSFRLNDRHHIRVELGIGAALHLENKSSWDNESPFPFKLALSKFSISESYPIIPALRFKIRYDLRLGK